MAIDAMKKVTLLCPVQAGSRLNRALHDVGLMELSDAHERYAEAKGILEHGDANPADSDLHLNRVNFILNLIESFFPEKKSFVQGLTPTPMIIEPQELHHAVGQTNLEAMFDEASEIDDAIKCAQRRIADIDAQLEALAPFGDLSINMADFQRSSKVALLFGTIPNKKIESIGTRLAAEDGIAWEAVQPGAAERANQDAGPAPSKSNRTRIVVAALPDDLAQARTILASEGFEELALPKVPGKVRDRIRELHADRATCEEQLREIEARVGKLAGHRRELQVLRAHWDSVRRQELARSQAVQGRWVHMVTGYVRERDLAAFEAALLREVPEVSIVAEAPEAEDAVPVSISLPKLVKPVQMLVNLFGLPAYSSFDPSPFILVNFYLFFGICFGDVGYGLMLTALGGYIAMKTRMYEGVYNFGRLLFFAGISTTICGVLFGSWLGDLYNPTYLGEDNLLLRIKDTFMIMDPLADPVGMLVLALSLGMLNQFYGIALKAYGAARVGDWVTAACDGLFWLITLPGLVIMISKVFVELPPAVFNLGVGMFVVGAIGLVLTQGREAKGLVAKLGTGIVSLYGIVGSYGCTAFIGDTLSYCRLLALALTTAIIALTVNMIAGLLGDIPYIGPVLFIVVLVLGHIFNFSISLLGAFVHAMRLIFVEFFGRFYEGGAKPFTPFGFDSPSYVLNRAASSKS